MKRPRSDSKLDALDTDQQRQLCEWLLTPGLSYKLIVKQVFEEFNVSTSAAALSNFYQEYCGAYMVQRRREAVGVAEKLAEDAKQNPGEWSPALIEGLKQRTFELLSNPMVDAEAVSFLMGLVLKAGDQELKRDAQKLQWKRFQRQTCELFIKWYKDQRAQEIMASGASQSDMIEALGRHMWPEDWEELAS